MSAQKNITDNYKQNLDIIKNITHSDINTDIIIREFLSGTGKKCFLIYVDGMADVIRINDYIIRPLMLNKNNNAAAENIIEMSVIKQQSVFDDIVKSILSGDTAVYTEGTTEMQICETKGFDRRSVTTPQTEVVIKGSQEAFTENIRTNITLLRKILKTVDLITEFHNIGSLNNEYCAILYIENLTNKDLVNEVKQRIERISADYVEGSGMLEQLITSDKFSVIPSMLSTERPERAANYLSEGRVIIICNGTPFAMVAPVSLSLLLDSSELNTMRWQSGTQVKIVRMVAAFISIFLPSLYIAFTCFHREMVPTQLLSSIIKARENIPFATPMSVIMMILFFDLIREAGQRIPRSIGNAIGIVGGLILGQAAVEANLVSPVTLIVVAISGLSVVAIPDYDLASSFKIIQFFFLLSASVLGLLGIAAATTIVVAITVNQKSFGIPILSIRSIRWASGSSMFFQRPLKKQKKRTLELDPQKENTGM